MTSPAPFSLHHAIVDPGGATRWMILLHGILGSGANWRTFANKLGAAAPGWGFVLVDLRAHGQSLEAPPPHTVAAAADDVARLEVTLGLPIAAVAGHSFGGKVALEYLARRSGPVVSRGWLLDANPGTRSDGLADMGAAKVLELLESLPPALPSRDAFLAMVTERGFSRPLAEWLAMNVRRDPVAVGGAEVAPLRFRLHLPTIRALLTDYFAQDLWAMVESPDRARVGALHVVVGGRSDSWSSADRARLDAATRSGLRVHVLEIAGHWLHVDDPAGLLRVMADGLGEPEGS